MPVIAQDTPNQRRIGREFLLDDKTRDVGRDPVDQFPARSFVEGSLTCDRPSLGGGADLKRLKLRVLFNHSSLPGLSAD
ncbi:MAG: hypothetical protein ACI9OU_001162 [Candidatus Promineifilaceae bacterium]|jgi:hypothetical protein